MKGYAIGLFYMKENGRKHRPLVRLKLYRQLNGFVKHYMTKVCGHLLVEHLIPESWAVIWSWSPVRR
jgi:hypothetical protein